MTNRLNNCEQANMDKIFYTASREIKAIERLKELGVYDMMDDKIKEVMEYRLKYPEYSLQELSDIISTETKNKITKSGLNHRFRKIRETLEQIDNKDKK
jgi:DNA-binding protein WhiA